MRAPFSIGGTQVTAGKRAKIEIPVARLVTQAMLHLPVVVVHGRQDGPRVWLSAALHGDELNGTEIIYRVLDGLDARRLKGTVVAVPVVNLFGFVHQSRYLPDRRDLNRAFPGSGKGSLAAQLAHLFLSEIVDHCTHGIDFHTGSNRRVNHPQVRGTLEDEQIRRMAESFSAPFVVHSKTLPGSLREAARRRGIPSVIYEAGEPQRFSRRAIEAGTAGTQRVLRDLGMTATAPEPSEPSRAIRTTRWLRAGRSGILNLRVRGGEEVVDGQVLATIRDPYGKRGGRVIAHDRGFVLGHTTNPLVNRGDAVVNLGLPG